MTMELYAKEQCSHQEEVLNLFPKRHLVHRNMILSRTQADPT